MDKFEKILDIIDHRDKYSDEEIREILQDEECRKLYQTMQEVDSAFLKEENHEVDVDAEWKKFSESHRSSSWHKIAASIAGFVLVSGIAFAAIHAYVRKSQEPMPIVEHVATVDSVKGDTATVGAVLAEKAEKPTAHKTFENVAFDKMLAEIAAYYDLQVKFESDDVKTLRLYYEWDCHRRVEDIIKELNQFENVDIALRGNEVIVK